MKVLPNAAFVSSVSTIAMLDYRQSSTAGRRLTSRLPSRVRRADNRSRLLMSLQMGARRHWFARRPGHRARSYRWRIDGRHDRADHRCRVQGAREKPCLNYVNERRSEPAAGQARGNSPVGRATAPTGSSASAYRIWSKSLSTIGGPGYPTPEAMLGAKVTRAVKRSHISRSTSTLVAVLADGSRVENSSELSRRRWSYTGSTIR